MRQPGLKYDSPNRFTGKQRFILATAPPLMAFVLKNLLRTCRIAVRHPEHLENTLLQDNGAIICSWHETIPFLLQTHQNRSFHTVTSYSFDGELAARMVAQYGNEAVRGSTSRGGANALRQLEKALSLVKCVGLTLDGPRGPRRVAHPGAAILALRSGKPLIPHASAISHCHRLRSWDRLPIPRPFSRVICAYGAPIHPEGSVTRDNVEALRFQLETALNALHTVLETELDVDVGL